MHALTCRTDGCFNQNKSIIVNSVGEEVWCGVCGNEIVDIDPPLPEKEPEEIPEWLV